MRSARLETMSSERKRNRSPSEYRRGAFAHFLFCAPFVFLCAEPIARLTCVCGVRLRLQELQLIPTLSLCGANRSRRKFEYGMCGETGG